MNTSIRAIAAISTVLLLAACQTPPAGEQKETYSQKMLRERDEALVSMNLVQGEEANNLYNFRVNGFKAINDMNVILYAGVKEKYLVTLFAPCMNLTFAWNIGIRSYSSQVRNYDTIVVSSPGYPHERCHIDKIIKLNEVPKPATTPAPTTPAPAAKQS